MRCSRCGYIGFRAGAKCDNCNAKLKVAKTSSIFSKKDASLDDSFSINPHTEVGAAGAKILAAEQGNGSGGKSNSTGNGNDSNPFINKEGEFDLDLSEVLKKEETQSQIIDPANFMSSPTPEDLNFSDTLPVEVEELDEIDLGEIEVEGLGFDFDASDIGYEEVEDEGIESVDKPADEVIEEGPDTQETDSTQERIETTDLNEYKEMNPSDDEPVMNLGEIEETPPDEIPGEPEPKTEIPDLSVGLDEEEAEQIREKESEEPKILIEELGLELDTIENQSTLNSKLDSEDSSK